MEVSEPRLELSAQWGLKAAGRHPLLQGLCCRERLQPWSNLCWELSYETGDT